MTREYQGSVHLADSLFEIAQQRSIAAQTSFQSNGDELQY